MPRITRKQQKVFAVDAQNNGVFGSLQANDPVYSQDPDVIQSRTAYSNGWDDATYSSELLPPLEEFQGLQYLFSRQLSYVFQEGVPEWETNTTYYTGSICKTISGTRVMMFLSLVDNNQGNLTSDTTKWYMFFDSESAYANVHLSNLTSTGKNIGNWSTNVTNCITYIPQDIKLELSNGTLTLKAGSKVYVPNGAGVFDEVVTSSDSTISSSNNDTWLIYYDNSSNSLHGRALSYQTGSGTTTPSSDYWVYYNTSDNKIYEISNGVVTSASCSLPLAIVTATTSGITSIDQVFNGFGYIGSTVFALPGVKGLIPNGRNDDGTLKNTEISVSSVLTKTFTATEQTNIALRQDEVQYHKFVYDEKRNLNDAKNWMNAGSMTLTSGVISNFNPKTVFHSLDWNDGAKLSGNNTFSGANVFNEGVALGPGTYVKARNNNLEGGALIFESAPNEPNYGKIIYIERYNGSLKATLVSSSNVINTFGINAESGSVEASSAVSSSFVYWGTPNYPAIVSVGNVTDRAAPSNVLVQCSLTGRAIGYLSVGGQTFYINHQDGYGTTNYIYRDFYIPKGWKYTTSGLSEVYEIPLMGG